MLTFHRYAISAFSPALWIIVKFWNTLFQFVETLFFQASIPSLHESIRIIRNTQDIKQKSRSGCPTWKSWDQTSILFCRNRVWFCSSNILDRTFPLDNHHTSGYNYSCLWSASRLSQNKMVSDWTHSLAFKEWTIFTMSPSTRKFSLLCINLFLAGRGGGEESTTFSMKEVACWFTFWHMLPNLNKCPRMFSCHCSCISRTYSSTKPKLQATIPGTDHILWCYGNVKMQLNFLKVYFQLPCMSLIDW